MANPARIPDPRLDPVDQVPPSTDPLTPDPRLSPANSSDPRFVNRVESRGMGSGVLIAAIVLVLAVVAYVIFAPGSGTNVPAAPDTPAVTEPAPPPAAPAPDAAAPAAPDAAAPAAPAPDATAPASPDAIAPAAPEASPPAAPAAPESAPAQ